MKSKSKMFEDRYFIECSCGTPDHLLCFDISIEKEDAEKEIDIQIAAYFTASGRESFFRRIKTAFKYIFSPESIVLGDSVIITEDNIKDLEEVIDKIKKLRDDRTFVYKKMILDELGEVLNGSSSLDLSEEFQLDTIRNLIRKIKEIKEKPQADVIYGDGTKVKVDI